MFPYVRSMVLEMVFARTAVKTALDVFGKMAEEEKAKYEMGRLTKEMETWRK